MGDAVPELSLPPRSPARARSPEHKSMPNSPFTIIRGKRGHGCLTLPCQLLARVVPIGVDTRPAESGSFGLQQVCSDVVLNALAVAECPVSAGLEMCIAIFNFRSFSICVCVCVCVCTRIDALGVVCATTGAVRRTHQRTPPSSAAAGDNGHAPSQPRIYFRVISRRFDFFALCERVTSTLHRHAFVHTCCETNCPALQSCLSRGNLSFCCR